MVEMKKILLLIFFHSANLSAQLNFSVTGGVNYSKFNSILFGRTYYDVYNKYYKFIAWPNLGIEVSYLSKKFKYLTGISYSYRGTYDYFDPLQIYKNNYDFDINGYVEIPLQMHYTFYKNKLETGLGIVMHKRVYNGSHYYDERNKFYGLDLRVNACWNINRSLALVPSYTFGNFDKYIHNTYGNFLHHVFALNLRYTFLHCHSKNKDKTLKK